jgi:hypothetical protein
MNNENAKTIEDYKAEIENYKLQIEVYKAQIKILETLDSQRRQDAVAALFN